MSEISKTIFFGVGGGGCNCLNHLMEANLKNVEFIAANTDSLSLARSNSPVKILLGAELLQGSCAAGQVPLGRQAALDNAGEIAAIVENAEMVMISATLGGGTGSGAAPVIASLAHEKGALVAAFVARPFIFEGETRAGNAAASLLELKKYVDVLFEFKNDGILENESITMLEAFAELDRRILEGARCFIEMMTPGLVSIDQQDLRYMIDGFCEGYIAIGHGSGENMAAEAVESMLADGTEKFAGEPMNGMVINFSSGPEFSGGRLLECVEQVNKVFGTDMPVHMTTRVSDEMAGRLKLSIVCLRPRSR
ncbi:MAG TPA: cell division protein FtsZ [Candidatus Rifleibacterium sp.]|nr:cell division protein FtsZ [Candidatus Rifleibacterium sp.]HPT45352.1 cell division protein FtsZ [Candidatus Rifleibacterium sp.]